MVSLRCRLADLRAGREASLRLAGEDVRFLPAQVDLVFGTADGEAQSLVGDTAVKVVLNLIIHGPAERPNHSSATHGGILNHKRWRSPLNCVGSQPTLNRESARTVRATAACKTDSSALTWDYCWWQVLGSNQHSLRDGFTDRSFWLVDMPTGLRLSGQLPAS